jgi:hypothetical protein
LQRRRADAHTNSQLHQLIQGSNELLGSGLCHFADAMRIFELELN